jgi:DNA-binding LacI/PurR family transcriptional regulator
MATRRSSLADVAAAAAVSITTASDALNGKGRLATTTRERVQRAAERLGYQPNPLARSLVGGRTGLIAVAFSQTTDITAAMADKDYLRQAIVAVTGVALEIGVGLIVGPPTRHPEMWTKVPMDGLIVFSPVRDDPLLPQIRREGIPMVLVGRDPDGAGNDPCVDNDHVAGTRTVLDHLQTRGASRPALLAIALEDAFTDDCLIGYRSWCTERAIEPNVVMIPAGSTPRQVNASVRELLSGPGSPDAVHATVWELGTRAAELATSLGIRIPDDLMVAACGDTEPHPGEIQITQLKLFPELAAREAVDLLTSIVRGIPSPIARSVPTELAVRQSTARA